MSEATGDLLPFILLRALTIIVGLAFAWMGYRLFLAGMSKPVGDLEIEAGKGFKLKFMKAAPGAFFALFGAGIIIFQITRVLQYSSAPPVDADPALEQPDRGTVEQPPGAVRICDTCPPVPGRIQPRPSGGTVICDTCAVPASEPR